jgi:4-hydroxy-3-methylbut-2-en-1-yl diphosphate reductase
MMALEIEKAANTGFCFGVRRAIDMLEKAVAECGKLETMGAVVHNQQVLQRLAEIGITVAGDIEDIKGNVVAISSHGVSPQVEAELKKRKLNVIDTTCPSVHRAQVTARRLAEDGFLVVIYGDANHPEVKGLLGWAGGKGIATLDSKFVSTLDHIPRRMGVLSQTTQIHSSFVDFIKAVIDSAFIRDSEFRAIDTICHDIRERQVDALELAKKVDLMLVIGGRSSANTRHLADLCATVTETHHIETAGDIQESWLKGKRRVGVSSGASTADQTIDEVLARLAELDGKRKA